MNLRNLVEGISITDDIDNLVKLSQQELSIEQKQAFLELPIITLLESNLIVHLYLHQKQDKQFIIKLENIIDKNKPLIIDTKNINILCLLTAIHPEIKASLNIYLVAYYLADDERKKLLSEIIRKIDKNSIMKIHLKLAKNIDKEIYEDLCNIYFDKTPQHSPNYIANVKFIQSTIRKKIRTHQIYPALFKLPKENLPIFNQKFRKKLTQLAKIKLSTESNMQDIALQYLCLREKQCTHSRSLCFISPYTYHYVGSANSLESIYQTSYLYSQQARRNLSMRNFSSFNTEDDIEIGDHHLLCTSPFYNFPYIKSEAKLKIDLQKIPLSILDNCVIKITDFHFKNKIGYFKPIEIADSIFMLALPFSHSSKYNINRSKSYYAFQYNSIDREIKYILEIPAQDEMYHGLEGFKEAMCHFLFMIQSLPDEGDAKIIKEKIIAHLNKLHEKNALNEYLDKIFKYLFQYMEIDFHYGLPFSFEYISAVQYDGMDEEISFNDLIGAFNKDKIDESIEYYDDIIKKQAIFNNLIEHIHPLYFQTLINKLDMQYPKQYFNFMTEMTLLHQMTNHQLHTYAKKLIQPTQILKYDLPKLLVAIKSKLPIHEEKYYAIAESNIDPLVVTQLKDIYDDFHFSGGNSIIRSIFRHHQLIHSLSDINLITYALHFQAYNEITKRDKYNVIAQVTSQRTNEKFDITFYSILYHLLNQPLFFLNATPLNINTNQTYSTRDCLLQYIKNKAIFQYHYQNYYQKFEGNLLKLCQKYNVDVSTCLTSTNTRFEYNPKNWKQYLDEMKNILTELNEKFFSNTNIPKEVNYGLSELFKYLFYSEDSQPSIDEIVKRLLSSTALLEPIIAHHLFDATHFPAALLSEIRAIQTSDGKSITFCELILACIENIALTGVNESNALMAEQLALRLKQLQFDCFNQPSLNEKNYNGSQPSLG